MPRVQGLLACLAVLTLVTLAVSFEPSSVACYPRPMTQGRCVPDDYCQLGYKVESSWKGCPSETICCVTDVPVAKADVALMKRSVEKFSIPIYGKWCGPGYSGGKTGKEGPIDQIDAACQAHDSCYRTKGYFQCSCNAALVKGLGPAISRAKGVKSKVLGFGIKTFFEIMPCNKPGAFKTLKALIKDGPRLVHALERIGGGAVKGMNGVVRRLKGTGKKLKGFAKNGVKKVKGFLKNGVKDVRGFVKNGARKFGGFVKKESKKVGGLVKKGVRKFRTFAENGGKKFGGFVKKEAKKFGGFVKNGAKKVGGFLKNTGKKIGGFVKNDAKKVKGFVTKGVKKVVNFVKNPIKTFQSIEQKVKNPIKSVVSGAKDVASKGVSLAKKGFKKLGGFFGLKRTAA